LVVAVTVLSLLMSPLWTLTARRLHGLAAEGIDTMDEVLAIAWGRETEIAKRSLSVASGRTRTLVLRLMDAAKEVKDRRTQRKLASSVTNDNPIMTAKARSKKKPKEKGDQKSA